MDSPKINSTQHFGSGKNSLHASYGPNKSIEPILLLDMDEEGKFILSKRALNFINEIETNVAVISVVGNYRTGKSFLLNRFAGQ